MSEDKTSERQLYTALDGLLAAIDAFRNAPKTKRPSGAYVDAMDAEKGSLLGNGRSLLRGHLKCIVTAADVPFDPQSILIELAELKKARSDLETLSRQLDEISFRPALCERLPPDPPLEAWFAAIDARRAILETGRHAYRVGLSGPAANHQLRFVAQAALSFFIFWISKKVTVSINSNKFPSGFAGVGLTAMASLNLLDFNLADLRQNWPTMDAEKQGFGKSALNYALEEYKRKNLSSPPKLDPNPD